MSQGPDTIGKVKIEFPMQFSAITAVFVVVLTLVYWEASNSFKETLIFFAALSAAGAQICATFYTARLLAETIRQNKLASDREIASMTRAERVEASEQARAQHEKVMQSLQFGTRYNDPSMYHIRDTMREIVMHNGLAEELLVVVARKSTNVIHILNFIEEMGTSHRLDICNRDLLKSQFDAIVVGVWLKLSPWIHEHRTDRGCKEMWQETERLYDLWKNAP